MDIQLIVDVLVPTAVGGIGWLIRSQYRMEKKVDDMRTELRGDMEKFVAKDTCDARCEGLEARIESLEKRQELNLAQAVNDTRRMQALYDHMSPTERRAHAAQCLFKHDMEGIG